MCFHSVRLRSRRKHSGPFFKENFIFSVRGYVETPVPGCLSPSRLRSTNYRTPSLTRVSRRGRYSPRREGTYIPDLMKVAYVGKSLPFEFELDPLVPILFRLGFYSLLVTPNSRTVDYNFSLKSGLLNHTSSVKILLLSLCDPELPRPWDPYLALRY